MTSTDVWALRGADPGVALRDPTEERSHHPLAPQQPRVCARCGRYTTFVLEDPADGWYACVECGRLA